MATVHILYWQDIPSLVEARDDDAVKKEQLSPRFQALIDLVAMKKDLAGTDAYLEHWRKGKPEQRDGSAEQAVQAVVQELEAAFESIQTTAIAACGKK